MKADGITLSTVGAGGGANPFLEQLAKQGGGRFYPAPNPASIPDIFLKETQQVSGQQIVEEPFFPIQTSSLADPARARRRACRSSSATTGRPSSRPPRPCWSRSRDDPLLAQWQYGLGPVRGVDVRLDRALGQGLGRLARLRPVLQPARQLDVPGRGDRRHRGDLRDDRHERTVAARRERRGGRLAARLLPDAAPCIVGPDLEPHDGRARAGGAGRLRGDRSASSTRARTRSGSPRPSPGSSPLGRTVGLVAPTSAEYRQLGTDEPFLGSLRAATGGTVVTTATRAVDPRPADHEPLHRPVAAAADPGAAALAARHRAAAGVGRAARARAGARAGSAGSADGGARRHRGRRPGRASSRHASGRPARHRGRRCGSPGRRRPSRPGRRRRAPRGRQWPLRHPRSLEASRPGGELEHRPIEASWIRGEERPEPDAAIRALGASGRATCDSARGPDRHAHQAPRREARQGPLSDRVSSHAGRLRRPVIPSQRCPPSAWLSPPC